jgi:hypothetical protein
MDTYVVETPDPAQQFSSFLAMGRGSSLFVDEGSSDFLLSLTRELRNHEVYNEIASHFQVSLTLSTAIHGIRNRDFLDFTSEESIGFIASQFFALRPSVVKKIPVSTLFEILSHDSLRLLSENALYEWISASAVANPDYWSLLQFVRFEYLSPDCLGHSISVLGRRLDMVGPAAWAALSERLILPFTRFDPVSQFPLKKRGNMNGIIAYLTRKCGGNVHEKGIVSITPASLGSRLDDSISKLADLRESSFFNTKNQSGPWICWDFHNLRIRPTHYSIRGVALNNLKSWIVEISTDGVDWTEIDRQIDSQALSGVQKTDSFEVSGSHECRFIRLSQIGRNHLGNDQLVLSGFEVFGTLRE